MIIFTNPNILVSERKYFESRVYKIHMCEFEIQRKIKF